MISKRILAALCLVPGLSALPVSHAISEEMDRRPVYGSLYGGGSTFDVDFDFAAPLGFDPEDEGDTFGLGVGYEINDNWFLQLDYTQTDASDVDIQQVFLSLNYQRSFLLPNLNGVVGVIVGEGNLDWNSQPEFSNALRDDLDADQSLYGLQIGFNYDIADHWSMSLMYQVFDQAFKTSLETPNDGRLEFEHSNHQYLLFGLRFHL